MKKTKDYKKMKNIMCLIFVALAIFYFASAVSAVWTGGEFSVNAEQSILSAGGTNNSGNYLFNISAGSIYGNYQSAYYSGRLFDPKNSGNVIYPAELTLIMPENDTTLINKDYSFEYRVNYIDNIANCSLYIDANFQSSENNPPLNTVNSFQISNIPDGQHNWNIICANSTDQYSTPIRIFRMLDLSNYTGSGTTNVTNSSENNPLVSNFTLEKTGAGKITFSGITNISNLNNIAAYIQISDKTINVNSAALPELNKSATLEIYNIVYNYPLIWKDNAVCSDCSIISNGAGTLKFSVNGFSSYEITSTSKLEIFDDTDSETRYPNNTVIYSANYTDIISGNSLSGNCDISFNLGGWTPSESMTFNPATQTYEYSREINTSGNFNYAVSCTTVEPGYDNLNLQEIVAISPTTTATQNFLITDAGVVESSRANITTTSDTNYAEASNVSQLMLNTTTITTAWQGFYGDIIPNIRLIDSNSNILYSWNYSIRKGQVFASRSNTVSWESIGCISSAGIDAENVFIGKTTNNDDNVNRTFAYTDHPHFVVGNILLKNCASTQTRTTGGAKSATLWNILLSDSNGNGNIVYTALLNSNSTGYNNMPTDFQLLVGENGNDEISTPYYFYVEMD